MRERDGGAPTSSGRGPSHCLAVRRCHEGERVCCTWGPGPREVLMSSPQEGTCMGYLLVVAVFVILVGLGLFAFSAAMLLVGRVLGLLFPITTAIIHLLL